MVYENQLIDIFFFTDWTLGIIFLFNILQVSCNLIRALVAKSADPGIGPSEKIEEHPTQSPPPVPGDGKEDPNKNKTWWQRHWGKVVGGFVLFCIVVNVWIGGPKNF